MKLKDAISDMLRLTWSDCCMSEFGNEGKLVISKWHKSYCVISNGVILAHLNKYPVTITSSIRSRISQVLKELVLEGKVEKVGHGAHRWCGSSDPYCIKGSYPAYSSNLLVWRESLGKYVYSLDAESDIPPFCATKKESPKSSKTELKKFIHHIYDEASIEAELNTLSSEGMTLVSVINTGKHRLKKKKK
jgi:hypothetical protein